MLCNGPEAKVSEQFSKGGRQIVCVEPAGVWKNPDAASAEAGLLEADAGVFDAGDDAVGMDADECDNRRPPALNLCLEAMPSVAKFVVGEFIGASGRAFDDVRDPEPQVKKERSLKRGKEARSKSAGVHCGPESIAGPSEVAADGRGVKAGIDAREEDN